MDKEFAKKRIEELRDDINYHNKLYYDEDKNSISDYEYDQKMNALVDLEKKFPELKSKNSPSIKVGGKITKEFETFKHSNPMLSLSNTYSEKDLNDFDKRTKKSLGVENIEYVCELKYDGIALSILYEDGRFKRALTRGDGNYGDDISNNVLTIKTLPLNLERASKLKIEVRGEAFISKKNFEKLNQNKKLNKETLFSNPRNTTSGSLKMQDSSIVAKRKINCFIYSLTTDLNNVYSHENSLIYLRRLGFNVPKTYKKCIDIEEVKNYIKSWESKRHNLDVETDGIVIKVNNIEYQKKLGNTSKSPRWAIAYKYKAESKRTKVKDIIFQVGRTGAITPVAILKPVNLSGSIVKRASLHNSNEIKRLDIRINDSVYIEKGGEIIPKITSVDTNDRDSFSEKFEYIKECPSCGSKLEKIENQAVHYCTNKVNCKSQISGKIEHFISKNAMNIEHLGPETIKGLIVNNIISNVSDLYKIKYNDIINLEFKVNHLEKIRSLKDKSCLNILESIKESKKRSFSSLFFGLGIRFVGKTIAEKLTKHFQEIDSLINASYEEIISVDEIGDKIAESLIYHFSQKENIDIINNLKVSGLKLREDKKTNSKKSYKLNNMIFVVSGKFLNFSREQIHEEIKNNGGKVSKSLSSKTNYLVSGEKIGPMKKIKADKLKISIITEDEFMKMI